MLKVPENKKLKLNTALRGHDAGAVIRVKTDKNGTALDPYWRRRVKDSEVDGCVEFVDNRKELKQSNKATKAVSAED